MKKAGFTILLLGFMLSIQAQTVYYISPNGSSSYNGLSESKPFKTVQKAADLVNPGDTVYIMDGTYTSTDASILSVTRSGGEGGSIVFKALPGHTPKFKAAGSIWHFVHINASFIVLDGIELEGNNANLTYEAAMAAYEDAKNGGSNWYHYGKFNTNGITIGGVNESVSPHHVTIRNCRIHDFQGCGISAAKTDYTTLENNEVFNNAWYSMYATSGISLIYFFNLNQETGYKNFVRNNICYNNKTLVPWVSLGRMSDGNGIIIDDFKNTQESSLKVRYVGRTLVENNICYNNGGSGIHSFSSVHVDLFNNTGYHNGTVVGYADIFAGSSEDVRLLNNIMYSRTGGQCNSNYSNTNVIYDYNIYFNGTVAKKGTHDKVANPAFVNISTDPLVADFRLTTGSPAIDAGSSVDFAASDMTGLVRPQGAGVDCGAYEQVVQTALSPKNSRKESRCYVYPTPTDTYLQISCPIHNAIQNITIFNPEGKLMARVEGGESLLRVDVSDFQPGIYIARITGHESTVSLKWIKR